MTGGLKMQMTLMVDPEKCTGCRLCVHGCPYGALFFNEMRGVIGKCDLCINRVHSGIEPACVQHCIGGALQFVSHEELNNITLGEHILRMGMVYYASSKWKLRKLG